MLMQLCVILTFYGNFKLDAQLNHETINVQLLHCLLLNLNNNLCVLKYPPADLSDASNPAKSARLNSGPAPGSLQTFILRTLATTWMKRN